MLSMAVNCSLNHCFNRDSVFSMIFFSPLLFLLPLLLLLIHKESCLLLSFVLILINIFTLYAEI